MHIKNTPGFRAEDCSLALRLANPNGTEWPALELMVNMPHEIAANLLRAVAARLDGIPESNRDQELLRLVAYDRATTE